MQNFKQIQDASVKGKKVFVRCDFDVPLDSEKNILDDTRLISCLSTIEYLLEEGAIVIAAGHLGRPKGEDKMFSMEPVVNWFVQELTGGEIIKTHLNGLRAWKLKNNFFMLENLRFYPGEESNSRDFIQKLSYMSDIYVNEAFGSSHRNHASIVGVPKLLRSFAGFHLTKEIKVLSSILDNPKRPLTFIVGGAKIETKLPLISKMHEFADFVLVGGELAEQDKILIKEQQEKNPRNKAILIVADLNSEKTDITHMSLENFSQIIQRSSCIIWNGPMGYLEKGFVDSTMGIANSIINSRAKKIVGGGDTIGFLNENNLLTKFDFASTGGGAMLEFLSGIELPGIKTLQN